MNALNSYAYPYICSLQDSWSIHGIILAHVKFYFFITLHCNFKGLNLHPPINLHETKIILISTPYPADIMYLSIFKNANCCSILDYYFFRFWNRKNTCVPEKEGNYWNFEIFANICVLFLGIQAKIKQWPWQLSLFRGTFL